MLTSERNHDEIDGNFYKDKKDEWLDNVKNDVFCTSFCFAGYCKAVQDLTGLSMKDCLSVPGLGLKYFDSLRTEDDEPIYIYNDK